MAGGNPSSNTPALDEETPFERRVGHHPGLFAVFFAEMWERFSYYGMRALLLFYITKGFLQYSDTRGYAVYGAYTALVYMTPFIGGMVADRFIGQRAAVIVGGSLMAMGHLLMTLQFEVSFFVALALLIVGNGFFKPNIGTILGSLYSNERLKAKRDGGFTIFYMGVNLGAAMAPLLCGYIGETYGWHYGFGLATIGMMIGLAIFIAPTIVTQSMIGVGAVTTAATLIWTGSQQTVWVLGVNIFVAVALLVAMVFALWALANGGLPSEAGAFKHPIAKQVDVPGADYREPAIAAPDRAVFMRNISGVLACTALIVPVFAWLVYAQAVAGYVLITVGVIALGYIIFEAVRVTKVERERLFVILVMAFFSMLFWAFFEQAGSSINNFTDRNIDRVTEARHITEADVGHTLDLAVNQEQLGYIADHGVFTRERFEELVQRNAVEASADPAPESPQRPLRQFWVLDASLVGETLQAWPDAAGEPTEFVLSEDTSGPSGAHVGGSFPLRVTENLIGRSHRELFTLDRLDAARSAAQAAGQSEVHQQWMISADHVGMGVEGAEIPASVFQAANPVYILIFGLVFTALWTWLAAKNREPSTPVKFIFALLQLGLGFVALYVGAMNADARGMVGMSWLLLAYLLHTTGELCLSPVGLSMVSKLSPTRMIATMMGAWYLATAFSQYLASMIAALTGGGEEGAEAPTSVPIPLESLHLYDAVYLKIAIASFIAAVILGALTPLVKKWTHGESV